MTRPWTCEVPAPAANGRNKAPIFERGRGAGLRCARCSRRGCRSLPPTARRGVWARRRAAPSTPEAPSREDRRMTTDLTGDFELGEEEFDWDVFVPDPDDAEIAAEAAALEDEDELGLDDSDFDWDAALREDPDPEDGADGGARAGAAYDRIVDTVRRSFEEPQSEADPEPEPEPSAVQSTETLAATAAGPEAAERAGALFGAPEPEDGLDQEVWL